MPILTVRNLDPAVQAKLRQRAAMHGRSMEAEARAIITAAVEADVEPTNLAASIRRHFADADLTELVLQPRGEPQREVDVE